MTKRWADQACASVSRFDQKTSSSSAEWRAPCHGSPRASIWTRAEVVLNARLEVEGRLGPDGVLEAEEIEFTGDP